jgi:hypothetical protein
LNFTLDAPQQAPLDEAALQSLTEFEETELSRDKKRETGACIAPAIVPVIPVAIGWRKKKKKTFLSSLNNATYSFLLDALVR